MCGDALDEPEQRRHRLSQLAVAEPVRQDPEGEQRGEQGLDPGIAEAQRRGALSINSARTMKLVECLGSDGAVMADALDAQQAPVGGKRSVGSFDPKRWMDEGYGLLASATKTRETWTNHRQTFTQAVKTKETQYQRRVADWNLLTGLPRTQCY